MQEDHKEHVSDVTRAMLFGVSYLWSECCQYILKYLYLAEIFMAEIIGNLRLVWGTFQQKQNKKKPKQWRDPDMKQDWQNI